MFMSEYNHSLDTKGRLIIPVKYREELGNEFVVTKGLKDCLWVFPMSVWETFMNDLSSLPKLNANTGKLLRHFSAGATCCELDKQGRILLPANLRKFADLDKDVVLAGMMERVEIWDEAKWEENNNIDPLEAAEELEKGGVTCQALM